MRRTVKMKKAAKNKRAAIKKSMGEIDVTMVMCDGVPSKEMMEQLVKAGVADHCWICNPDGDGMALVI